MDTGQVIPAKKTLSFDTGVEAVIRRTHDTKSFRFARPQGFDYLAGQWVYANIKVEDKTQMHHFTLSSSPTEDYLEFTKKITDHPYSVALDRLGEGGWVHLNGPYGNFTFTGEYPKIAGLTGGIGITPLRSIIRYVADKKLATDVRMLYSNKTVGDVAFKDEFDSISGEHRNIGVKYVLTREPGWNGLTGHIDAEMVRTQIPDYSERIFFICGPPAMNEALKKALKELGMPDEKIRVEDFPGY